jgi:hypothetical protein
MSAITSSVHQTSQSFKTGEVIPLLQRGIGDESLLRNGEIPYPDRPPFRKTVRINRHEVIELEHVLPSEKALINKAFELISAVSDADIYASERSNCFDEWKDLLTDLSRRVNNFTNNHRKILGSLISSTINKDISDFPIDNSLRVLQEATNTIRRPRINKVECKRAISDLLKLKSDTMIPLCIDKDDEKESELDELMETLLKKSRYDE